MRRKDREVTRADEIRRILDSCKTACVAMIDGDTPYVVPLSYGYELTGDRLVLYFHSAKEGRKLDVFRRNNRVCFTIFSEGESLLSENPCNSGYYFSSVIGNGAVEIIDDPNEKRVALQKMYERQTGRTVEFTEAQANLIAALKIVSADYTAKRKQRS